MDVDGATFYALIPDILNDVADSLFVALDLELSGVPVKRIRAPGQSTGKQTMQQRYNEVKAAAEQYQILQIGLTFVHRDSETGKHVCKPYNIPISPLVQDSTLDLERSITFSSGAATFLKSVGFDFNIPFTNGVPYITQIEAASAEERFDARQQRAGKPTSLNVKDTDIEALAYLDTARQQIKKWLTSTRLKKDDWLNIGPPTFNTPGQDAQPDMTNYQKWLIHQLVQVEFPDFRTVSKRGFIQIVRHNVANESKKLAEKRAEFRTRLARQKGLGWVFEALLGIHMDTSALSQCVYECQEVYDHDEVYEQIQQVCNRLRHRASIIVGHNCFLDLVYIYHTFIDKLPSSVDDFASKLHASFPIVIDTKYMATHNCGDIPPHSSLEELAHRLEPKGSTASTTDTVDPSHKKYQDPDVMFYHEAGFDSLLTAQVAIRLSRQLEAAGTYVEELDDGGVTLPKSGVEQHSSMVSKAVDKSLHAVSAALSTLGLDSGKTSTASAGSVGADSARSASNRFELLSGHTVEHSTDESGAGVPSLDSDFWRVYGNRLRVFGTQEGVLALEQPQQ